MTIHTRLSVALLSLRVSVFIVMLMWSLDKFYRPSHTSGIYQHFYHLPGPGNDLVYVIAIVELIILLAFALGMYKTLSYGLVLLLHSISTLSSYQQYANPFSGVNLLFFAAWPMLAACLALFLLRDADTLCTVGGMRKTAHPQSG